MDQMTIVAIEAVLQMIAQFVVPLVTKNEATQDQIETVINAIEKLLPIIGDRIAVFSGTLKNIMAALSATPGTPQEQYDRIRAIDQIVDAAADKAISDVDPDKDDPPTPSTA